MVLRKEIKIHDTVKFHQYNAILHSFSYTFFNIVETLHVEILNEVR